MSSNAHMTEGVVPEEEIEGQKKHRAPVKKETPVGVGEIVLATVEDLLDWSPLFAAALFVLCGHDLHFTALGRSLAFVPAIFFVTVLMLVWMKCNPLSGSCAKRPFSILRKLIPLSFCGLFLFAEKHFVWAVVLFLLPFALAAGWFVLLGKRSLDPHHHKKAEKVRMKKTLRAFAAFFVLLTFIPAIVGYTAGDAKPLLPTDRPAAHSIDENAERLADLARFDTLDLQNRIDLAQTVADTECTMLGIDPVSVRGDLLAGSISGEYHHADRTIYLDTEDLATASAADVLKTVLHEVRHAYQNDAADLVEACPEAMRSAAYFEQARAWKDNRNNYVPVTKDQTGYFTQPLEADAREYADMRVTVYTDRFLVSNG